MRGNLLELAILLPFVLWSPHTYQYIETVDNRIDYLKLGLSGISNHCNFLSNQINRNIAS